MCLYDKDSYDLNTLKSDFETKNSQSWQNNSSWTVIVIINIFVAYIIFA